jgi:thiol-disulfide isomerase/thioredoxin
MNGYWILIDELCIRKEEFVTLIAEGIDDEKKDRLVVLDCYATWCGTLIFPSVPHSPFPLIYPIHPIHPIFVPINHAPCDLSLQY